MGDISVKRLRTRIPANPRQRAASQPSVPGSPRQTQQISHQLAQRGGHARTQPAPVLGASPRRATPPQIEMVQGQAALLAKAREQLEANQPDKVRETLGVTGLCAHFNPAVITLAYQTSSHADHYLNHCADQLKQQNFIVVLDGIPELARKYGVARHQVPDKLLAAGVEFQGLSQPEGLRDMDNLRYLLELLTSAPLAKGKESPGKQTRALKARQNEILEDLKAVARNLLAYMDQSPGAHPRLEAQRSLLKSLQKGETSVKALRPEAALLIEACDPGKEARGQMETSAEARRTRADQLVALQQSGRKVLVRASSLLLHDVAIVKEESVWGDDGNLQKVKAEPAGRLAGLTEAVKERLKTTGAPAPVFPLVLTPFRKQVSDKIRVGEALKIELAVQAQAGGRQIARVAHTEDTGLLLVDFTLFKA